jgi:hypothetical protein
VKSYLPGFPVKAGCLPVAKVFLRPDRSLCDSVQGDWVGGVVQTAKLPPLPL